ncbi:MAG TPA: hypothetical protein PLL69_04005, partial [Gemmatimonadales bacterium]|nr:hypothetical protein [Gemmatimonadales bacterium]
MRLPRLGAVLVLAACGGGDAPPPAQDSAQTAGQPPATQAVTVTSLDELAPGDTLGLLALMRRAIDDGNSRAATAEKSDTVMPGDGYREARTYTLWKSGDVPVKLVATEPNDAGLMRLETVVWFENGEARVVQQPFAIHYLDSDRLVLWTDEAMVPVDAPV